LPTRYAERHWRGRGGRRGFIDEMVEPGETRERLTGAAGDGEAASVILAGKG